MGTPKEIGTQQDYDEGYAVSASVPDCAEQSTTQETIDAGGPDFSADDWCCRPQKYHQGYDAAILDARAAQSLSPPEEP